MTIRDLAELADVTPKTVRKWITNGVKGVYLRSRSVGRRVEIERSDYEAFNRAIEARRNRPRLPMVEA